jgi:hypothetical protein
MLQLRHDFLYDFLNIPLVCDDAIAQTDNTAQAGKVEPSQWSYLDICQVRRRVLAIHDVHRAHSSSSSSSSSSC